MPFDEDRSIDRVNSLLTGQVSGMMVTADTLYDLEKTGQINRFNKLTDNNQLKIYAGGGADYAVAASFLQNRARRREEIHGRDLRRHRYGKKRQSKSVGVCRQERAQPGGRQDRVSLQALHRRRNSGATASEKSRVSSLGIQMAGLITPSARALKAQELVDAALVPELEKEGRCNF